MTSPILLLVPTSERVFKRLDLPPNSERFARIVHFLGPFRLLGVKILAISFHNTRFRDLPFKILKKKKLDDSH